MFTRPGVKYTTRPEVIASEHYTSQSGTATQAMATDVDGRKIVLAGTVYPSNDEKAIGIVVADVDVTDGDAPVAYMDHGSVYKNRMPKQPADTAVTALKNIFFREYK